ncbi:hypothetical protein Pla175_03130 [Pirellulimonas nuda]|uniref:Uncharacterized protein n=1 Tax=Pirellulimonas nuda TaxID=2528009 RepID=A0A518D674_9BACT|nr:hypothetical protein [Pirellulimonas nuda]QDU86959.1 hypothetical protein Pla175_03130 [Pirellulimonas nuda]
MKPSDPQPDAAVWTTQDWRAFAAQTADAIGGALECREDGYSEIAAPAAAPAADGAGHKSEARGRRRFGGAKQNEVVLAEEPPAPFACGAPPAAFLEMLLGSLAAHAPIQLRPADQPEAVHDLSPGLFAAYQVDGGAMHLAGCRLTDRPLVRVTRPAAGDQVEHAFFLPDGQPLAEAQIAELGLDRLAPSSSASYPHETVAAPALERIATRLGARVVAVVWVKHAECRLRFEIGDAWHDLPLAGWARSLGPAPVACPVTGRETFHLTALEDGTIVAAEEVGVCQQTRKRELARDMARCSVTGQTVLAELCDECPVSGLPTLATEFDECSGCGERVSRATLLRGECAACRNLLKVSDIDEVIAELLGRYPKLRRWGRWRAAQTGEVAIVEGRRLLGRLRLTVGIDTGDVRRAAIARGPWGQVRALTDAERGEQLG